MRSIGIKNVNLVKRTTREAIKNRAVDCYGTLSYSGIEDEVVGDLPIELWDTWEMADQQIRRIIDDTIME